MMNPSAKILILDEDALFSHHLARSLAECGHSLEVFHSGEQGLLHAVSERCDLILLNIELPQKSGLEFLHDLRKSRSTPVVVMDDGGENREVVRIEAFRQGADDYWIKPFNFIEAQLRVAAILRRTCGWNQDPLCADTLQVGPLHLNRRDLKARVNHREVELTQVQFKLLWHLARHHNQILPKAHLHTLVLEKPYCQHDRSIDMHLSRVRKKLTDVGLNADRVQTVHGRGYCFA
jgi:two-component system, OmpR family, response regulator PfeR